MKRKRFPVEQIGGVLVWVGLTPEPVSLDDGLFHRKEATLLASRNSSDSFRRSFGPWSWAPWTLRTASRIGSTSTRYLAVCRVARTEGTGQGNDRSRRCRRL